MFVQVKFFASLKEKMGSPDIELEIEGDISIGELRQRLIQVRPAAAESLRRALAAINNQFAFDEEIIFPGADVAFFPPVSGGSIGVTIARITREALDQNALVSQITSQNTGAVCCFTGIVRGVTQGDDPHHTAMLEYEAYQPMAEAKIRRITEEIRQLWPGIEGIAIVQRIGTLDAGTPSVVIACSASHRDTGVFEAARYGIDRLKEIVPVWKKEIGPDGEVWVDGDYQVKHDD